MNIRFPKINFEDKPAFVQWFVRPPLNSSLCNHSWLSNYHMEFILFTFGIDNVLKFNMFLLTNSLHQKIWPTLKLGKAFDLGGKDKYIILAHQQNRSQVLRCECRRSIWFSVRMCDGVRCHIMWRLSWAAKKIRNYTNTEQKKANLTVSAMTR